MFLTKPEINYKMMPLAPTSTALMASKPKIGFSIDSIVGDRTAEASNNFSPNSEEPTERRSSPFNNCYGSDLRMRIQRERDQSPQEQQPSRRQLEHTADHIRSPPKRDNSANSPYSLTNMYAQCEPTNIISSASQITAE